MVRTSHDNGTDVRSASHLLLLENGWCGRGRGSGAEPKPRPVPVASEAKVPVHPRVFARSNHIPEMVRPALGRLCS